MSASTPAPTPRRSGRNNHYAGRSMRWLDPLATRNRAGQPQMEGTWYVADRLIVRGAPALQAGRVDGSIADLVMFAETDETAFRPVRDAARELRYEVALDYTGDRPPLAAARAMGERVPQTPEDADDDAYGFALRLIPEDPDEVPDARLVLESLGGRLVPGDPRSPRVTLDHILTADPVSAFGPLSAPHPVSAFGPLSAPHPVSAYGPLSAPHPVSAPHPALGQYAQPGFGGRAPVHRLGPPPHRSLVPPAGAEDVTVVKGVRRPVVAILDSGIGSHDWFGTHELDGGGDGRGVVLRGVELDGKPIGVYPVAADERYDSEIGGVGSRPLTGPLDPAAGHGTFIAGVVHQLCPDALLLPVRVFGGEGVVAEWDLLQSLRRLLRFHLRALRGKTGYFPVDVAVLSAGYYHEVPEDVLYDDPLREVLRGLRRAGVLVVVSAGNNGETRPAFPAAFAPLVDRRSSSPRFRDGEVLSRKFPPQLTVGALNPDGTVAAFSNDGPWVTCNRQGAGVVSTFPTTFDGSWTPTIRIPDHSGSGVRSTLDPDDYSGGFGIWSGTSFAAPHLAGELAQAILKLRKSGAGPTEKEGSSDNLDASVKARVHVAWRAIKEVVGLQPSAELEDDECEDATG